MPPGVEAWVFSAATCRPWWVAACREGLAAANAGVLRARDPTSHMIGPIDVTCPVVTTLMLHSAVLGDGIARGAARWQDLLHAHDRLFQDAVSCGALEYTPVDLRYSPRGHMQPLGFEVRPVNLRAASRELAALFLACVWLEANQHDHLTSGGREWAGPKYSAVELASWMGEVFGERVEPAVVVAAISFCAKGGAAQGCT